MLPETIMGEMRLWWVMTWLTVLLPGVDSMQDQEFGR
jgi:hypothetical protein